MTKEKSNLRNYREDVRQVRPVSVETVERLALVIRYDLVFSVTEEQWISDGQHRRK
jgi:hypothetical protein